MADTRLFQELLDRIHKKHVNNTKGHVASYIPELAKVDPEPFGIAIATVNNDIVTVGDADEMFSIQSISKPFVFGMALEHFGVEATYKKVGTEPSGEAFNSIELNPKTGLPYNPMVNSGAIAMSSMISSKFGEQAEQKVLELFGNLSNSNSEIDLDIYQSELSTAHRNRALAYLMRGAGVVDDPVEKAIDLYVRQCSIKTSARQLAIMGATLANFGNNPISGDTIYSPLTVRNILSTMFTCGMYDYAGRWAVDVGLPAKSGVSGGVLAVVNRQIGIGIYSPRLDEVGNSVRAINACIDLAEELGLHAFEFTNKGSGLLDLYL
jgi:glutaminase